MLLKDVVQTLERFAPLPLQESYDNAGLQIGLTEAEDVSGVLVCLDVTEDVVSEAIARGCNLIVAHHPLLFRPLRHITQATQPERVVRLALRAGIAIYAAHTNLDNASGGVCARMAAQIGLANTAPLEALNDKGDGSGLLGELQNPLSIDEFLALVKLRFGSACVRHNHYLRNRITRVALCGGAGEGLIEAARHAGAEAFVTGEIGYHRFFGLESEMLLCAIGHYESERFTIPLLREIIEGMHPSFPVLEAQTCTNPICCR